MRPITDGLGVLQMFKVNCGLRQTQLFTLVDKDIAAERDPVPPRCQVRNDVYDSCCPHRLATRGTSWFENARSRPAAQKGHLTIAVSLTECLGIEFGYLGFKK